MSLAIELTPIAQAPRDCWIVAGTTGALIDVLRWNEDCNAWGNQHDQYPMPQPDYWLSNLPSICPAPD